MNTESEENTYFVQIGLISIIYLICSISWHGGGARAVLLKLGSLIKEEKFQTFSLH